MIYVLETIMGYEVVNLWHKDTDLQGVDCVVLPGGFSYGDYLRSGAIAKMSPIMGSVIDFANNGGYVLAFVTVSKSLQKVDCCQEPCVTTTAISSSVKMYSSSQ